MDTTTKNIIEKLQTSDTMKVKIRDLHANPYRKLKNYPINDDKVKALVTSINTTGFWDNILARNHNGKIEIAYGHHRLAALKKSKDYTSDTYVNIPVKDLSDSLMIKIMANENMSDWEATPAVIDETVRVTRDFLKEHPEELKEHQTYKLSDLKISVTAIASFLNWKVVDVQYSMERLEAMKKGEVDKEALNKMPSSNAAMNFVDAVKETELTPFKQKKLAQEIKDGLLNKWDIKDRAIKMKFGDNEKKKKPHEDKKALEFETYAAGLENKASSFLDELKRFERLQKDLNFPAPGKKVISLYETLGFITKRILLIIKSNENEKQATKAKNGNASGTYSKRLIEG